MRLQQTKKLMFSIGNHQRQKKKKKKKKEKGNRLFTNQIYDKMLISKI